MDMRYESYELRQAVSAGCKYFVLIVGKGEGCDFTMGCNIAFYPLFREGTTLEEAFKGVYEHLGHDEYRVETALVIEASQIVLFDVEKHYRDAEKQDTEDQRCAAERSEKAEYERLKAKFA